MRAVLWCNGSIPPSSVVESVIYDDVSIFGVDGGADRALELGIKVVEVLGDLDSVDALVWEGKTVELSEQSTSDLSKSLGLLIGRGFDEIDIIGADDGDPGHILGSWAAMNEAPPGARIRIHHRSHMTTRLHPDEGEMSMELGLGEPFSVFALRSGKVWISGAKWEMSGDLLSFSTRGLHNEGMGGPVSVKGDGVLAIISQR